MNISDYTNWITVKEHMPESHRKWLEWTPERFISTGRPPDTRALIERILGSRVYPQQAFRSCLGILRLSKGYGNDRLEAAKGPLPSALSATAALSRS